MSSNTFSMLRVAALILACTWTTIISAAPVGPVTDIQNHPNNEVPGDNLLLNGGAAYYNVYETADKRFIALGALEPKFWRTFCKAVRKEEWIERQNESLPQQQLISELRLLFLQQPLSHWNDLLLTVDCCYEPVPTLNELSTHPQVRARGLLKGKEPVYPAWIDGEPMQANRSSQPKPGHS